MRTQALSNDCTGAAYQGPKLTFYQRVSVTSIYHLDFLHLRVFSYDYVIVTPV